MSDPRPAPGDLDPRTGEPRRPLLAWVASGLVWGGGAIAIAGLLQTLWVSIHDYPAGAWLNRLLAFPSGDPLRVLPVIGAWIIAVAVATVACLVGYYAWAGYRWTRVGGLVAVGVGLLTLLLNPLASWCLAPLGLGAGLLWLPTLRAFFDRWQARRHPVTELRRDDAAPVIYGPAARYRVSS